MSFFSKNIVWYALGVFIFSRIFYVIGKWNELKYIRNPLDFFIMNDYNFSLFGALFGFFLVFIINEKLKKNEGEKKQYFDGIVLSFIFVLFIGYIGTLLGGQVYGRETSIGIEIMYNHPFTSVPFQVPIFPLPIVYSFLFFVLFCVLYITSMFVKIRGFIGYIGLLSFSCIILIFEFFSGKHDIVKNASFMNFSQFLSFFLIIICAYKLYELSNNQATPEKTKGSKSIKK